MNTKKWAVVAGIIALCGCNTFADVEDNAASSNNATNNASNNSTNNATNNATNNGTNASNNANTTNNSTNNNALCTNTVRETGLDNAEAARPASPLMCSDAALTEEMVTYQESVAQNCSDVSVAMVPHPTNGFLTHLGYGGEGGTFAVSLVGFEALEKDFNDVQGVSVVSEGSRPLGAMLGFECPNDVFLAFSSTEQTLPIGEYTCARESNPFVGLASVGGFDANSGMDTPSYFVFGEFPPDGVPQLVSLPTQNPTPEARLATTLPNGTGPDFLKIRGSSGRLVAIATSSGVYIWDAVGPGGQRCEAETQAPLRIDDLPNVEAFDLVHLGDDRYLLGIPGRPLQLIHYVTNRIQVRDSDVLLPASGPFAMAEVRGGVVLVSSPAESGVLRVELLRYDASDPWLSVSQSGEIAMVGVEALDVDARNDDNDCDVIASIGVARRVGLVQRVGLRDVRFRGVPQ